jgi:hypothetical protein
VKEMNIVNSSFIDNVLGPKSRLIYTGPVKKLNIENIEFGDLRYGSEEFDSY